MPPERLFDYLSVRLNGERAASKVLRINVDYTDLEKGYGLRVQNAVLHYSTIQESQPQASVQRSKATLDKLILGETTLQQVMDSGTG